MRENLIDFVEDKINGNWFGLEIVKNTGGVVFHILGNENEKQQNYSFNTSEKDIIKIEQIANALNNWIEHNRNKNV